MLCRQADRNVLSAGRRKVLPVSTPPLPMLHPQPPSAERRLSWRQHRQLRHEPYGLEIATVHVDGREVRSLSTGERTTAPELVFIPGMGSPGYLAPWARQSAAWTRATILDLPGWHHRRARSCAPSLDGVAAATARWLQVTGRTDVVLVGHSTGSQSALRVALLVPERLRGVVLAGPTFEPGTRTLGRVLRRSPTLVREAPGEVPAVLPSYLRSGGLPLLRLLLAAFPDRPEDVITDVRPPMLVMTGQDDGFAPPDWARRLATLADAPCVVLPGAHNSCYPFPLQSDDAIRLAVAGWTADTTATVSPAEGSHRGELPLSAASTYLRPNAATGSEIERD